MNDLDTAAKRAAAAAGVLRKTSGKERGAWLRQIAANLESNGAAIVQRANAETALPLPRLEGELARTCNQLRMFAALIEEGSWVDARIDHGKVDIRSMLRPLGPVAVFGASNFPLAFSVAGGDTASALAAGCPVIVKAHPAHPGTSELAAKAIEGAVPEGVFAIVFGYEIGVSLVQHPAIRAVGFTGSRRGGKALMDAAALRPDPIPFYAEMGSVNPVFILPGAMRERAGEIAAGLQASVTLGVGQFCTNPGLVIAQSASPFVDELRQKMSACAPAKMLTDGIAEAYRSGVARMAAAEGVERMVSIDDEGGVALFVTRAGTFLGNPMLAEEVFGPSTLVVECQGHEQLLDVARSLEGQLTVTLHATERDLEEHRDLLDIVETKAGRLIINGFPTGVEVTHAMVHGGPWPATSDGRSTSVGTRAIARFVRPVCYQNFPDSALPDELKESNPLGILRLVDGTSKRASS
jgi:alpha-ketoglutaric semialdehyde dehydrogenase